MMFTNSAVFASGTYRRVRFLIVDNNVVFVVNNRTNLPEIVPGWNRAALVGCVGVALTYPANTGLPPKHSSKGKLVVSCMLP